jgi:hypothetical protein
MSLATKIAQRKQEASLRESVKTKLHKEEKSYRGDKLIEAWSRVPEIGAGLTELPRADARNVAINLDRQAAFMGRLNEAQLSTALNGFTPENMLRIVRLAMPNIIRNKVFTDFALESMRDSIKYFRPVYTKNFKGNNKMARRHSQGYYGEEDYDATGAGAPGIDWSNADPFEITKDYSETFNDFNSDEFRRALYELGEDRFVQELANGIIIPFSAINGGMNVRIGKRSHILDDAQIPAATSMFIVFGKTNDDVCEFDLGYLDGYVTIFGKDETDVIATQNKRTKKFFINPDYTGLTIVPAVDDNGREVKGAFVLSTAGLAAGVTFPAEIRAFGRFDSEADFEGDYLGEIELIVSDYEFHPRPTSIGVTWSQLVEFALDTSFSVSVEEYLVSYASQEIRVALDYRAIKIAYSNARTNPAAYRVEFDAHWGVNQSLEGYIANAQTFQTAVFKVADVQLNDIRRGGVSRMVGGPSAASYTILMKEYSDKGRQPAIGPHQFGELGGMPLFKVPSDIIPTDEFLCVWKNDNNEADVSIAFGTLVPFFSTGLIQRKNFYKEAALASYGDWSVLNKRYLSIIKVQRLKDMTNN